MELSVQGGIIARPSAADLAAAVDASPKDANWYLSLDGDDGDFFDVGLDQDGRYRIVCLQKGERYLGVPADETELKAVLNSYLGGGQEWRQLCRWKLERNATSDPAARPAGSAEPPSWAIVAIIASVVVVIIYAGMPAGWRAALPFGGSELGFAVLIALPMLVLLTAMLVAKLIAVRAASRWPSTRGRIIRSGLTLADSDGETIEAPAFEYTFRVGGQRFMGTRIGLGDQTGSARSQAKLQRYPSGMAVTVYYNPKDPCDCVLERDMFGRAPKGG